MNTLIKNEKALPGTRSLVIADLKVDPRSQRELKPGWAGEIARNFDPDLLGVIHVSKRPDGSYWVIDGQHRLEAVRIWLGDKANGQRIDCKVYENLTLAEEAQLFVALNNQLHVSRMDRFLKAVTAKDPVAVKIDAIVRDAGFKIERFTGSRNIPAVGALHTVYTGFENGRRIKSGERANVFPDLLRAVLNVISLAWQGSAESCNGYIIEGIGRVMSARGRAIDVSALTQNLAAVPNGPVKVLAQARARRETLGGHLSNCVAAQIIEIYNKGRRTGKIEQL